MQRILRKHAYEYEMVAKEPKLEVRLGELEDAEAPVLCFLDTKGSGVLVV